MTNEITEQKQSGLHRHTHIRKQQNDDDLEMMKERNEDRLNRPVRFATLSSVISLN